MSKYIIDTNKYYLHEFDGALIVMMHEGKPVSVYESKDNLEELNSDYINEHYGQLQDEAYQRGLNDAWEAARKIVVDTDHGGIALSTLGEIFGTQAYSCIMRDNTASEAIAKLKAYEDKQTDRIEVGDEVKAAFGTAVVTYLEEDHVGYLYSTGTTGFDEPRNLTKTGKHYDIQSILEAMRK